MNLGFNEIDPEVGANTRRAAAVFESLGCSVEEVDLAWHHGVMDAWLTHWQGLFWAVAGDLYPRWKYEMDPFVVRILEAGRDHSAARMYNVNTVRGEMYQTLEPVLRKFDILITPTLCLPAVKADHDNADPDFEINGKKVPAYLGWIQTYPFNLMSQCPVASVPSGFSKSGVPTGLQIVAKTFNDMSVFRAASAFEIAQPWRGNRPDV